MAKELNGNDFDAEVLGFDGTVVVDFYAPWCGPCRSQAPILETLQAEMPEIKVVKINVDETPDLAATYGVMSIPTLLIFRSGTQTDKAVGLHSLAELKQLIG